MKNKIPCHDSALFTPGSELKATTRIPQEASRKIQNVSVEILGRRGKTRPSGPPLNEGRGRRDL